MEQNHSGIIAKQRIVRTEEQILSILEEYEKSGFTQKDFCEVSDINEVTFYSWLKKYRPKFATIEVVNAPRTKGSALAEISNI